LLFYFGFTDSGLLVFFNCKTCTSWIIKTIMFFNCKTCKTCTSWIYGFWIACVLYI